MSATMTDLLDRGTAPEPSDAVLPLPPSEAEAAAESWASRRDTRRGVEIAATIVIVGGAVLWTLAQLHPSLLFSNTTPTGGDMGAHVWAPAFLRDHILPKFRLTGWANDWYAGFPVYVFYMLPPALLVIAVNFLLPYGEALKIVSALGILSLPICCWAFGKLVGLRFPVPQMLSIASVIFLFDETFQIYGGNIASTMAGEYSFSIALSIAVLYFGVFAYCLRTGRHRALAAALFALACLCHGIVALFVIVGTIVLWLLWSAKRGSFKIFTSVAVVGGLLTAFWIIPFYWLHRYGTDMHYERGTDYLQMLFPQPPIGDLLLNGVAIIGLVGSVFRRSRAGVFLGVMAIIFGVWAVVQPQGLLWNYRLLPFLYLCRYLLAAVGVVEIGRALARLIRPGGRWLDWSFRLATLGIAALATWLALGLHFRVLPGGGLINDGGKQVYAWPASFPILKSDSAGYVKYWAKWNYEGYEAKDAYGEYYGVINTMKQVGSTQGCGRALWENNNDINKYGTPMALMLLPFWTDGCIGSMEGLFFEASGTTPYHFITAAAVSEQSSNPVRRLQYDNADLSKGVPYLQTLGVRYYLAYSPPIVAQADANPDLVPLATSGPWHVYEVKDVSLVSPLSTQPVVVRGVNSSSPDPWLEVGTSWFQHQSQWAALPVAGGPSSWQHIDVAPLPGQTTDDVRSLAQVSPTTPITAQQLAPVTVSNIKQTDDGISFDVDKVGVPVLVRESYFPDWKVSGAKGPYRAAPNFMVVVPTSTHVSLHYGYSGVEIFSYALTLIGIVGLVYLWRAGPVVPGRRVRRRPARLPALLGGAREVTPEEASAWPPPATDEEDQTLLFDWDEGPAPPSALATPPEGVATSTDVLVAPPEWPAPPAESLHPDEVARPPNGEHPPDEPPG